MSLVNFLINKQRPTIKVKFFNKDKQHRYKYINIKYM